MKQIHQKIFIAVILLLFSQIALQAQDAWKIKADSIDASNYFGVSVSNGNIGIVSSPEPLKVKEVILGGVYDKYGRGRTSNFLPSYNLLDLDISLGWKDIDPKSISNFKQELDMKTGTFYGSFDVKDVAHISYSYVALRQLPNNVMMEVTVTPLIDTNLGVKNTLRTPNSLRDNQLLYNEINLSHGYIPLLTSVAKSPSGNIDIVASNTFVFPEEMGEKPKVAHEIRDNDAHQMMFNKKLKKDEPYTFALIGSLISSVQNDDPYNQAERLSIYAGLQDPNILKANHNKAWEKLWQSDIEIDGDAQAQQDVHNMLYHLYSFIREDSGLSLSPMGLSGLGYNGHVFWDTEIFMFPPLLLLQSQLGKELIEYRYKRLDAAKKNASAYGYKGAMYPWESAMTGQEETPVWALSGTYEHHITGDVAFAAWQYYLATQDKEWLREKGWDILKNTADFWLSRIEDKEGKSEIKNIVCADEWAENVDNNAYTNAIAKINLENASAAAKILNLPGNKEWLKTAKNLKFDKLENGVTKEHDSYEGQQIKQADVNLLAYPLQVITDQAQIAKDLEYYQDKVPAEDTPAMTKSIFALLHSWLGNTDEAEKWFKESYEPNLLPPFRVMAETKGGVNPYFITGAGGALQTVLMGFGGIYIKPDGSIGQRKTVMPQSWDKLTIKGVGKDKITITK